jgi:DNA polymerase I-like protein with 3'-5' exonuclease and polymerase domains
VGISFSYEKGKGIFCPSRKQEEAKALIEKFIPFSKMKKLKIGQNLKYDLKYFQTMILM